MSERYLTAVRDTLDRLYRAPLPRTLINLVLVRDVRYIPPMNNVEHVCRVLRQHLCPCATITHAEHARLLDDYLAEYHRVLIDLVNSGRYNDRDDFTVVIQPFMGRTSYPHMNQHRLDSSYFSPDCFHLSGRFVHVRI
jgi:phospholipase B1, membrane-associated